VVAAQVTLAFEKGDYIGGGEGGPRPRRIDSTQLVDNEIIGSFIDREFLDPEAVTTGVSVMVGTTATEGKTAGLTVEAS
jgi:hypothetical protein